MDSPLPVRIDGSADTLDGPHERMLQRLKEEQNVLETTASRPRMIQQFSLDLLGRIEFCLKTDTPEVVATKVSVRGDGVLAMQILESARVHETNKPGGEPPDPKMMRVLDLVQERTDAGYTSKANQPTDLVQQLADRIIKGEDIRGWEIDLSNEQLHAIRELLPKPLQSIVDLIATNKSALQALLQLQSENEQLESELIRHWKFPEALNLRGFRTKFEELPLEKKNGVFLFFDLADFKQFNSEYKHNFVDKMILDRLCRMLRLQLPEDALLGIHGGDEFLLYDPNEQRTEREMASTVGTIIRDTMQNIEDDEIQSASSLLGERSLSPERTAQIKNALAALHAKLVVTRSQADISCAALESKTATGLKSTESQEMKSRFRFPTTVVTGDNGDLETSPVFSAIGKERSLEEAKPAADFGNITFLVGANGGVLEAI